MAMDTGSEVKCLMCGEPAQAEFVDIGGGTQRVTPYYCYDCEWTEGEDKYGNPEGRVINCYAPDCGCPESRLCMAEKKR